MEPPAPPVELSAKEVKARVKELEKEYEKKKEDCNMFEIALHTAQVEDLGKEQHAFYNRVQLRGTGLCSKCRFISS